MKKYFIIFILALAAILRLYALDKYPAGLNADEAAIGYNAWSLLETGKDEHSVSWPLVFRSFDDYKLPVYFYLVLPFVKLFGLSVWSVRLPSALLGIASICLVYLLVKNLYPDKNKYYLPELSALLLAISPWHLHFSRGGWEVNAATFFILLGMWAFSQALKKPKYFYLFVISFVLSLYTYHSARVIAPLLGLSLLIIYWQDIFSSSHSTIVIPDLIRNLYKSNTIKTFFLACLLGIILSLPIAVQLLSKEGQSRFSGVSIFADPGPSWQATNFRLQHGSESPLIKVIHNRYLSYTLRFVQNYLSHFSPDFLFINGDAIARSKVPEVGQSLLTLLPFFLIGLVSLLRFNSKGKTVFLVWFLVAPLAAALTYQSPHALRAANMAVPFMIISAFGLVEFYLFFKKNPPKIIIPLFLLVAFLVSYDFARYLHMYYVHYPKELPYAWQYGFDQIAAYTKENYAKYDRIIITDRYDQPYILIAFFSKYPPEKLQKEVVMSEPDRFGFATGRQLDKYEFRTIDYEKNKNLPNTLLVTAEEKVDDTKVIYTVKSPSGAIMFKFISTASPSSLREAK